MKFDVAVLGAGPAGLFCAHALAKADFSVVLIAPTIDQPWKNRYGVWVDELSTWSVPDGLDFVWPSVTVRFAQTTRQLHRPYARLHNANIQRHLKGGAFEKVNARATHVRHLEDRSEIDTESRTLTARLVIDARGAARPDQPAAQTAYGMSGKFSGDPLQGAEMLLMDWRQPDAHATPSFLYGMRDADGFFVEETVLTARPPVDIQHLKERLHIRLERMGVEIIEAEEEERCYIPMNLTRPRPARTIAVGAAAAFIHPATGYSVGRSVRAADELVRHFRRHWFEDTDTLAAGAWETVWSGRQRQNRRWYEIGHEVLLGLPPDMLIRFFEHFFECPEPLWRAYLSDTGSPADVQRLMWRVFQRVDVGLKWQLMLHSTRAALA